MPQNRPPIVSQLLEIWARLTHSQRITIFLFGFLGMALIGSLVFFMNRVDYETLYWDLSPEDAYAVKEKLQEEKKNFIVEETGSGITIKVAGSKSENALLRMDIAASGLAGSGRVGFDIFDKSQFGMTDFTEQINHQRALEGELSRTISSLSEVLQAKVHIVLPNESVFEEKTEEAKASVLVTLRRNSGLSKSSVAGITGLVAGAVPGLRSRNVSIVDNDGNLLTHAVESTEAERTEMESGYREQLEKQLESKVVGMLEPLVGKEKVRVTASLDMDFNHTEQMEETYNPNTPAVLSRQRTEERSGPDNGTDASGVPGTQSNLAPTEMQQSAGSILERIRQSESTNYEVSKTIRHTVQPKGSINRISVAVLLDHRRIHERTEEGGIKTMLEPIPKKDLDAYREIVLAAVGYVEDRGDVVTIENVPFFTETMPEEPSSEGSFYNKWREYLIPGMKYLAFLILFLLAYLIFLRPIRKRVSHALSFATAGIGEATEARLPAGEGPAALEDRKNAGSIEGSSETGNEGALQSGSPGAGGRLLSLEPSDEQIEQELLKEASLVSQGNRKVVALKKKLVEKANKDPEMVSQLIRSVLREGT
ncbi:MAG: flagellar M-ring protein FliF [Acidobacteria bacterium]|nr:flagellar M-ring protein FliF [Acidobacteriota bacterium]